MTKAQTSYSQSMKQKTHPRKTNPEVPTEQPEVTNVLLNQNGTPVVDDHGSMVPTSE
jgi:hypothetical protein